MYSAMNLVILTGAGISQESGISTFRDQNGLWENHRIEEVASPEGFARNPELVHQFYNLRRRQLSSVQPNPAHHALAELEREWQGEFLLITQNVDDLHARAGSRQLVAMHGELKKARCGACGEAVLWEGDLGRQHECGPCGKAGFMRPHIVWFGEVPFSLDEIYLHVSHADIFVSIGTSGNVYPAAGLVRMLPKGARKIEVNAAGTEISHAFDEHRRGPAGVLVPQLVNELLRK